jgi:NarL family two-component system response regulator YdfI
MSSSEVSIVETPQHHAPASEPIRVLIAAASSLARAGLERLIESQPNLQLVGGVEDSGLRSAISESDPDVLVLHTTIEPSLQVWRELTALNLPVVLCVENPDPSIAAVALAAGAQAILPGEVNASELHAAVMAAANRLLTVSSNLKDVVRQSLLNGIQNRGEELSKTDDSFPEHLTAREIEVLEMIVEGLSNKEIAAQLDLSTHTVKFHISSILGKLGASSRTEAATIGLRRGLITI